jgi:hypothetical protein
LEKELAMTAWERLREALGELYAIRDEFKTAYSGTVFMNVGEPLDHALSLVAGVNADYADARKARPLQGVEEELRRIRQALDMNWGAADDLEQALRDIERVTDVLAHAHNRHEWPPLEQAERRE